MLFAFVDKTSKPLLFWDLYYTKLYVIYESTFKVAFAKLFLDLRKLFVLYNHKMTTM